LTSVNRQILLILLAVLLVVKFAIVPWAEWQDEQHAELLTKAKKLQRSESLLLVRDEVRTQAEASGQQWQAALERFPQTADAQTIRLEMMQQIQQELAALQVKVNLFDWLAEEDLQVEGLKRASINLTLEGTLPNLTLAHLKLESGFPNMVVKQLRSAGATTLNTEVDVQINLLLHVYFKLEPAA